MIWIFGAAADKAWKKVPIISSNANRDLNLRRMSPS